MERQVAVPERVLLDVLARCVAASRSLGLTADERSLAADAALLEVDHIGRVVSELVGSSAAPFGFAPVSSAPEVFDGDHAHLMAHLAELGIDPADLDPAGIPIPPIPPVDDDAFRDLPTVDLITSAPVRP